MLAKEVELSLEHPGLFPFDAVITEYQQGCIISVSEFNAPVDYSADAEEIEQHAQVVFYVDEQSHCRGAYR
jgi:hypothetical protein